MLSAVQKNRGRWPRLSATAPPSRRAHRTQRRRLRTRGDRALIVEMAASRTRVDEKARLRRARRDLYFNGGLLAMCVAGALSHASGWDAGVRASLASLAAFALYATKVAVDGMSGYSKTILNMPPPPPPLPGEEDHHHGHGHASSSDDGHED